MNIYAKFGGAARRHFSICEKPMGGGGGHICAPLAVRGLNVVFIVYCVMQFQMPWQEAIFHI